MQSRFVQAEHFGRRRDSAEPSALVARDAAGESVGRTDERGLTSCRVCDPSTVGLMYRLWPIPVHGTHARRSRRRSHGRLAALAAELPAILERSVRARLLGPAVLMVGAPA